ncbi:MAG TPA: PAS domain S-box protein, partial [Thermoanaerobaculia bacterium]
MNANPTPSRNPEPEAFPGWLLAAWLITGIILVVLAVLAVRREDRTARAHWDSRLARAADDRLALADRALHQWREEARLLGRTESVRTLLGAGVGARPAAAETSARARRALAEGAQNEPGSVASVTDRGGRVVVSTGAAALVAEALAPARDAIHGRHPVLTRIAAAGSDGLGLEIVEPVLTDDGGAAGAVILLVDAKQALGELFAAPGESEPERLFIVVPDADTLLVVAPARSGESGGTFRLPASDRSTFAAAALAAPRAGGEYSDGRGHRVLSAARRIPEVGWALVVEVDRGEALAEARRHEIWILAGAAGLFVAILGLGLAWRRGLTARHFREMSERDARYRVLLEQTQEAVAVSVNGRVAYANPACVEMFGYQKSLVGVPITIFFAPGSREQVEEIVQHRV